MYIALKNLYDNYVQTDNDTVIAVTASRDFDKLYAKYRQLKDLGYITIKKEAPVFMHATLTNSGIEYAKHNL